MRCKQGFSDYENHRCPPRFETFNMKPSMENSVLISGKALFGIFAALETIFMECQVGYAGNGRHWCNQGTRAM